MSPARMSSDSPRNPHPHMSISALLSPETDSPDVIRAVLQKHFERTLETMPPPPRLDASDGGLGLLGHIGETVLHLQGMVAAIADELVYDKYHAQKADLSLDDGYADGGNMESMARIGSAFRTHNALSAILVSLKDGMRSTRAALDSASRPKQPPVAPMPTSRADQIFSPRSSFSASNRTDSFSGSRPGNRSIISDTSPPGALTYSANPSPESLDSPASPAIKSEAPFYDSEMNQVIKSLASRGKSSYVCKYGKSCTKGGVDKDGNMIVFERNCMIRQHIDKHEKPYRCEFEGCPNKEGFARRDQLDRHQRNVKHDAVS